MIYQKPPFFPGLYEQLFFLNFTHFSFTHYSVFSENRLGIYKRRYVGERFGGMIAWIIELCHFMRESVQILGQPDLGTEDLHLGIALAGSNLTIYSSTGAFIILFRVSSTSRFSILAKHDVLA